MSVKRKADDTENVGQSPTKKSRIEPLMKPGRMLIQPPSSSPKQWVWNQKFALPSSSNNSSSGIFFDSLKAELESIKFKSFRLSKTVEDQRAEIETLKAEKLLLTQNAQERNLCNLHTNEIVFLRSIIAEHKKTIEKLNEENCQLHNIKNQSWLIDEQRIKINHFVHENRILCQAAQERDKCHLQEIMVLKHDLAEHKGTIRKLETEKVKKDSTQNRLATTVKEQSYKIEDLHNKIDLLMKENQTVSQIALDQDKSQKKEILALKELIANYEQTIEKLRTEQREEGEISDEKDEELEILTQQVQHFQAEIESLKNRENREISKARKKEKEFDKMAHQIRELKSRVKTLDAENEALLELTKKSCNDHKSIKGINRDLRGEIRHLEREVGSNSNQSLITNFFVNVQGLQGGQPQFIPYPNNYSLRY